MNHSPALSVSTAESQGKGLHSPESIAALDASVKKLFEHYLMEKKVAYEGEPDIKVSALSNGQVRVMRDANHIGDGKLKKIKMDSHRIYFLSELFGNEMDRLDNPIQFDQGARMNRLADRIGLHHRSSAVTLEPSDLAIAINNLAKQYGITEEVKTAAINAQQAALALALPS